MNINSKKGISVILCCYNSATRIRETLHALSKQRVPTSLPWEIVLVDNASTDKTAAMARVIWSELNTNILLRIVPEAKPGLAHARNKGIEEAAYNYLLFCDDDTWLAPVYVQKCATILDSDPQIAACGGMGVPVFETSKPYWFDVYAEAFAIGAQDGARENGRILHLYGAGLGIKKSMIDQLHRTGFRSMMQGRVGKKLSSSEDTELTNALVLMGYNLYYTDELKFSHYLPKERLSFAYLQKLFTAFGSDGPVRNLYYAHISHRPVHQKITNWNIHFALSLFRLVKYLVVPPKKYGRVIYYRWSLAYIKELLQIRKDYPALIARIGQIKKTTPQRPFKHVENLMPVS